MKNWIRIFLVCSILLGGTALGVYVFFDQFLNVIDDANNSSIAMAKIPPSSFSEKVNKEQIPIPSPTTTPETVSTSIIPQTTPTFPSETVSISATSTAPAPSHDLKLSFIFPQKDKEVYIGCTYQLAFQSPTTIRSLDATLIDDDTTEIVEPIESGLAKENIISANTQSLDWKVKAVLPGEYYIKVSNINGIDLENYSKVFTISKMPRGMSVSEREKICKESDGVL